MQVCSCIAISASLMRVVWVCRRKSNASALSDLQLSRKLSAQFVTKVYCQLTSATWTASCEGCEPDTKMSAWELADCRE